MLPIAVASAVSPKLKQDRQKHRQPDMSRVMDFFLVRGLPLYGLMIDFVKT